jgi:transposase-like protein
MNDDTGLEQVRRPRRSSAEIQRIVGEYRSGSHTQREFAQSQGICVATLQNWLRKEPAKAGTPTEWIEVVASERVKAGNYRIELSGNRTLVLDSDWQPSRVRELIRILSDS